MKNFNKVVNVMFIFVLFMFVFMSVSRAEDHHVYKDVNVGVPGTLEYTEFYNVRVKPTQSGIILLSTDGKKEMVRILNEQVFVKPCTPTVCTPAGACHSESEVHGCGLVEPVIITNSAGSVDLNPFTSNLKTVYCTQGTTLHQFYNVTVKPIESGIAMTNPYTNEEVGRCVNMPTRIYPYHGKCVIIIPVPDGLISGTNYCGQ